MLKRIVFYISFFILVFFSGFITHSLVSTDKTKPLKINYSRSTQKGQLTNPLLDCEIYSDTYLVPINTLKSKINQIIDEYPDLPEVAVYYRDLNNGPWLGINEKAQFAPASLLKVPLMIAYLKNSEINPDLLSQKILYKGLHILPENLEAVDQLTPNRQYSIDQLISRMIGLSDNIAFEILTDNIDSPSIESIHKELDLIYPDKSTPEDYISIRSYAGLFRVLYNSTYLSRSMSEKALNYLINSDFEIGIRSGVPKDIIVANKFGYKDVPDQYDLTQLHDCGIIYAPNKPYLLCVMTKGANRDHQVEFIQKVSKEIYENLENIQ